MRWTPVLLFAGCAMGGAVTSPGAGSDAGAIIGSRDAQVHPIDASTTACTLGTVQSCGTCGHACPSDPMSTGATCSGPSASATCGITCIGEHYDVDGDASNGCEATDGPPQDSAGLAVPVTLPSTTGGSGSCTGKANPCTVVGQIDSDDRVHDTAPIMRPLGRPDWYVVTANAGGHGDSMTACLGITNYPIDNTYQVCISDGSSTTPDTCANASGGTTASACVTPPSHPNSGIFYVSVAKLAGTRTLFGYALYLEH